MSSFYTSVPSIMIRWYTVPKIWHMTDAIRDISRDYLGIAVYIGRVTKCEAEGIATL